VITAALALAGLYLAVTRWSASQAQISAPAQAAGGTPAITVSPAVYQLGQVSQARGIVTVDLSLRNTGTGDLVIREMETSCGCTRASLVVDDRAGSWFGMRGHGDWPVGWSGRLRPAQSGILRIQYDPDAHGIYRGRIDRMVVIHSSSSASPTLAQSTSPTLRSGSACCRCSNWVRLISSRSLARA
jgi:hypothetical protein